MRQLPKVFYNPPKGGNEVGVQTASSMGPLPTPQGPASRPIGAYDGGVSLRAQRRQRMSPEQMAAESIGEMQREEARRFAGSSGPAMQTSLRESLEAGEMAARNNSVHSGRAGQPEFRNYDRGNIPVSPKGDMNAFDYTMSQVGESYERGSSPNTRGPRAIHPQLRPDTHLSSRSDGKPNYTMGVNPSGDYNEFRSSGDNNADDRDDFDPAGGIASGKER